jgi:hypothetical protein
MTIAYAAAGTVGTGSTAVTPGLVAGLVDGDLAVVVAVSKPDTTTHVTPTGWSLAGTAAGGGGTNGNGTGPTRVSVFFRVKDATWSTAPAITCTGGNSSAAQMFRYTRDTAKTLDVASAGGAFSGNTTAWSAPMATDPGITADDLVLLASSTQDEAPAWSAETFTAPGLTLGTANERAEAIEGTTGNDVGGWLADRPVTAGTATGPATVTATSSVASRGATLLVRLREVIAALILTSTGLGQARAQAGSDSTTARTKNGTARAYAAASSDTTSSRPKTAAARATAAASSDSATTRVTTGRATAHAAASADTVATITVVTTGVARCAATAVADTATTRTTAGTSWSKAAAAADSATTRPTTGAGTAAASAVGDTTSQRPTDGTAAATASTGAGTASLRVTTGTALARAYGIGTTEGGTPSPSHTGTAPATAAAYAHVATIRLTTGTADARATGAGTTSSTSDDGGTPEPPQPQQRTRFLHAASAASSLHATPCYGCALQSRPVTKGRP